MLKSFLKSSIFFYLYYALTTSSENLHLVIILHYLSNLSTLFIKKLLRYVKTYTYSWQNSSISDTKFSY